MTRRERHLARLSGVVALLVVVYLATDRWVVPTWKRTSERVVEAEKDIALLEALVRTEPLLRERYRRSTKHALHHRSPEEAELLFVNQLNALARKAGMNPPNIRTLSPKDEKHFQLIRFTLQVRSTFGQFVNFLRAFDAHPVACRIDSLTVKPSSKYRSPDDPLSLTMIISAVVVPPQGEEKKARARA